MKKQRSVAQISYNMSRIKSKGTIIEMSFARALRSVGISYKKNYKHIIGTPDFVILDKKIAIFCDSAFWHGYKHMRTPRHNFKKRKSFWVQKILQNRQRDKTVNTELRRLGWSVIRLWDFQIHKDIKKCIAKVLSKIKK